MANFIFSVVADFSQPPVSLINLAFHFPDIWHYNLTIFWFNLFVPPPYLNEVQPMLGSKIKFSELFLLIHYFLPGKKTLYKTSFNRICLVSPAG